MSRVLPTLSAQSGVLFAALAISLLASCGQSETGPVAEPTSAMDRPVAVTVHQLRGQTVVDRAVFPADLVAKRRAALAAEVAGTIQRRHVREGQQVSRGQSLLTFDTRSLEQQLAEAEAVDRQRAVQLDRAHALIDRRSITQAQLLDAVTARDVAAAQLAAVRLQLEKSTLRAPWPGAVAVLHTEVGDFVSTGTPLVELVDTSTLEARATVPSSDVPFLRRGMIARVTVDAFPNQVLEGEIVRLGVEVDRRSRTLEAVVELSNQDGLLRPGLGARVSLQRRSMDQALLVPLAAVIELEVGHQVFVSDQATEDPRAESRPVRLGPVIGEHQVVVEEGLQAGDHLVVQGQRRVSHGQRLQLTIQPEADAPLADGPAGES